MSKDIPEVGEFVLATVEQITTFGVYVSLDEYDGMKGFLHSSEIATGRIRRIGRFIRVGQKEVLKVIRVSKARREINLSLKQITKQDKKNKLIDGKKNDKANKIMETVRNGLDLSQKDNDHFKSILEDKFGTVYQALEDLVRDGSNIFSDLEFSKDYINQLEKIAKDNISLPKVKIKGIMEISSMLPNGIDIIKEALFSAEKVIAPNTTVTLSYLSAPKYRIVVEAANYKEAENILKSAVDIAQDKMKKLGTFQFIRDKR